ncbi:MAG: hypothetical protein MH204_03580 [Fimbriimonadaceae bacterium]|nr:hypothetical protein [Fimbriimonadaceae bacterium]
MLAGLLLTAAMEPSRPPLLIHVMPWFEVMKDDWGYHWKMNRSRAELEKAGRVAAHHRPLIGAYDSLDPHVIELQISWMKAAGFDGLLADWYGTQPHFDYPMIHERTKALFDEAGRAGLTIGVVYEDQTFKNARDHGLVGADQGVRIARETGEFLAKDWLKRPNWWRIEGRPAVAVFGPQAFGEPEWSAMKSAAGGFRLITLHRRTPDAEGGMDWPVPSQGMEFTWDFPKRSADWGIRIACAFPRFHDWYEEGGQKGHLDLPDADGATYRRTLAEAIASKPDAIQVATWNDWQEGTQIEPSLEYGMRDLIATQEARRRLDPGFRYTAKDLDLPLAIYRLRKAGRSGLLLDRAREAFRAGRAAEARKILSGLEN